MKSGRGDQSPAVQATVAKLMDRSAGAGRCARGFGLGFVG